VRATTVSGLGSSGAGGLKAPERSLQLAAEGVTITGLDLKRRAYLTCCHPLHRPETRGVYRMGRASYKCRVRMPSGEGHLTGIAPRRNIRAVGSCSSFGTVEPTNGGTQAGRQAGQPL